MSYHWCRMVQTVCLGYIRYAVLHSGIVTRHLSAWHGGPLWRGAFGVWCLPIMCHFILLQKLLFSKKEKMQQTVQPLHVMECVKSLRVLRKVLTVICLYWSIVAGTFGLDLDSLSSINKRHFKSRLQPTVVPKRVFLLWVMPQCCQCNYFHGSSTILC